MTTDIVEKKWTQTELDLIKATTAPKCDENEFQLLLYQAKMYHLDPLLRQIWAVKYDPGQPARIFVGRDGYLSIAHNSGQFDGMETSIEGSGEDMTATTKVYRKDMKYPIVVSVKMKEYDKKSGNWKSMPETMLKKTSQTQALRQGFNISGVFSPEELPDKESEEFHGTTIDVTPTPLSDRLQTKEEKQWILDARAKDAKKKEQLITEA
jgi:phage recombination protein Bet